MPVPPARPRIAPLIAVADLPRAISFYTAGLGATVVTQLDHYALLDVDGSLLHLATEGPAPTDRADVPLAQPSDGSRSYLLVIDVADCVRAADDWSGSALDRSARRRSHPGAVNAGASCSTPTVMSSSERAPPHADQRLTCAVRLRAPRIVGQLRC